MSKGRWEWDALQRQIRVGREMREEELLWRQGMLERLATAEEQVSELEIQVDDLTVLPKSS